MKRRLFLMTATISISMIAFAVVVAAVEEWRAPARAAVKRNPVLADAASNKRGKAIYVSRCASCHGDSGSDLTNLRRQSDGELFWKITEGRNQMPSYATTLERATAVGCCELSAYPWKIAVR